MGAQVPHRDYHLGFVDVDQLAAYPRALHRMSAALTLQGAVAHCDMPMKSGPTMLLPYSQRFAGGYIAFYRPEFIDFFAEHHVQVPLRKGDAVFFNPALYHGAGANTSADIRRMANLLQISSPFGRAMEALDRAAMVRAVYPALRAMKAAGRPQRDLLNAVVATAEGYPFPTNLDRDQPIETSRRPSRPTPCWPRWPTTSAWKNSTSHCATKTIGGPHDHARRYRIGPHRRVPHRNPQRSGGC